MWRAPSAECKCKYKKESQFGVRPMFKKEANESHFMQSANLNKNWNA